jgi:c-di-GMP-binding flagellar brake protein YcgR
MADVENGNERRRYARFYVDEAPVELRRGGLAALLGRIRGGVVNLSEGGIRVAVPSRLPSRGTIRCRVSTARFQDPLEAVGEILWCERDLMNEKGYLVGILFRELEPRHARKIAAMREWYASPEFKALRAARRA